MMLTMTIRKLTCCMTGKQVRDRTGWMDGNGNAKVGEMAGKRRSEVAGRIREQGLALLWGNYRQAIFHIS